MAATGRRISGIYIPIQLDTQQIEQDFARLRNELGTLAAGMAQSLDSSLNPRTLINNFANLTRSIGNVRDAAKALEQLRPFGNFDRMLQSNIITPQLQELAKTLGITEEAQRKLLQTMARNTAVNQQVNGLRQLERVMGTTRKETLALAQSMGMLIDRQARIQYMGSQGRGILGAFTPSNMTAGLQSAMGAMGVVGGMYGFVELTKSMGKAALQMENIKLGFESIYGSAGLAANKLDYVKKVSDELGLSFLNAAEGAKKMFAAAKGTEVEADVENIFYAFSTMGAALKLSGDQMDSVFLALSQSISKGKLSAEEMRQQLAERMPGAIQLLAKSMGVTTQELDKMFQAGTVGLKNLVGFAEEVRRTYEGGARAASTGLQAELNRVSNAWFDLKKAFIDTDKTADYVRALGNALKYVTNNAETIAKVVTELGKFALITAGIYGASKAVMALVGSFIALRQAVAAGGLLSFISSLGPMGAGLGAASIAVGGLVYGLISMNSSMSESDKRVEKMSNQFFDMQRSIQDLAGTMDEFNDKVKETEANELEKKFKEARSAFNEMLQTMPREISLGANFGEFDLDTVTVGATSKLDELFGKLSVEMQKIGQGELGNAFEQTAKEAAAKFSRGLSQNLSSEQLNALFLDLQYTFAKFGNTLASVKESQEAKDALEKIQNAVLGLGEGARKASVDMVELGKKTAESTKVLEQSNSAYESIKKLAQATDVGRENKTAEGINSVVKALVDLNKIAVDAKAGLEVLDMSMEGSKDSAYNFNQEIAIFESSLPLVASLAVKNGADFQTMGNQLWDAGIQARFTTDQLYKLYDALQMAFNVEIGKGIQQSLQQLDTKIVMVGAKTAQTSAFSILTQNIKDAEAQTKIGSAIMGGRINELKDIVKQFGITAEQVDAVMQKTALFGSKSESAKGGSRGGARRTASAVQSAREKMSEYAKEIGNVEKKIASLQSKYDDDASIKYWADVKGELEKIDNILAKGAGTQAEKQRLTELRAQYEQLAQDRAKQMAEEEKRQRAIEAASKFGRGYGNLADVSGGVNTEMQVASLRAQYEQMVIDWDKALNQKTVTYEQYVAGIDALTQELDIKVSSAEGSMIANFTDHLMDSMEELTDWQSDISEMFVSGIDTMSGALSDFFITGMTNAESLDKAFANMVSSMIKSLGELFMKMILVNTVGGIFKNFFGSAPTSGFSGSSSNTSAFGPVIPNGVYAKGGVIAGGNISQYSGSVVTRPTFFTGNPIKAFAGGGNVMGEKGAEAILPLTKNPRTGRLSVEAIGGGQSVEMNQAIAINVYNQTDSKVSAKKTTDSNGNVDIQIMIEKMIGDAMRRPGSAPFEALKSNWGGSTMLADR